MKVNANVSERLQSLMFEMGRLIRGEMIKHLGPLSLLHAETLRFVGEEKNPTMREVADFLAVSAPTATDIITSLVRDKCLARESDPKDRRKVRLVLTGGGRRSLARLQKGKVRAFARVLAPLSARDRVELTRILGVITRR